ncbi:hypothetical protein DPV78_008262 [Talaromyces pinophilus]|nr:hypothetical protein DPV78_008262 [Talaromyces pinophilus]
MIQLINLPIELLIIIYEEPENIDDALHLARSCKWMYKVLDTQSHRLSICSHIIQNGDHHKYDLRLDTSETFCHSFRNKHYTTGEPVSDSERPLFSEEIFGGRSPDPMYRKLVPDTVWSIVTRWHAMKILFDLYCDSTVRRSFLWSALWQTTDQISSLSRQEDIYGKPLPAPSGENCRVIQSMTMAEKMEAYARFYRALGSHWLHGNMTWTAGVSRHADFSACEDAFGKIMLLWLDDCEHSSLQEKAETIEVTDFVWGFLALMLFSNPDAPNSFKGHLQLNEFLDEPILSNLPGNVPPYTRLVRLATFYLPPPHIIELLLNMWTPETVPQSSHPVDSCRVNKRHYLRRLGFFDKKTGTLGDDSLGDASSNFTTEALIMMEWWGMDRLLGGGIVPIPGFLPLPFVSWQLYRLYRWKDDMRGKTILYLWSEQQLTKRIKAYGKAWGLD